MTKAEKHLLVSLYDWCAQTTDQEINRNFETLLRLKSSSATAYVEFITAAEKKGCGKAAGLALVKRFHAPALRLKGKEFTPDDQQLVDEFINFARFKRFAAKPPITSMRTREKVSKLVRDSPLKACLDSLLGKAEGLEGGVIKYETVKGSFRIVTYVDLGGRLPLRYSHRIVARSGPALCETSLLHWHGIATETTWDTMGTAEVGSSIEFLAELCTRFLVAIETICGIPR